MDGWMAGCHIFSHWHKDIVKSWPCLTWGLKQLEAQAIVSGMEKDGTSSNCQGVLTAMCVVFSSETKAVHAHLTILWVEWMNKHEQVKHVRTVGYTSFCWLTTVMSEGINTNWSNWVVGFTFQNDDHSGKACVGYRQHCTTSPTKSSVVPHLTKPQWPMAIMAW